MPLIFETKNKFLIFKKGFFHIRTSIFYMRNFIIISIINYLILEIGYFIEEN